MKRIVISLLVGLLGSAAASVPAWTQVRAQISGTVRDQSGAVLPGVEVTATQTDTGISWTAVPFAQPALGTIGNMRPSSIEGPSTWQFDMALSRFFQVRENQRLEFRAEAFNVTNSIIMPPTLVAAPGFAAGGPVANLNSNTFGQILNSRDARIMQFALKYSF